MSLTIRDISHVLLDIEGTTCPVSFVASTLFPYASSHMARYLEGHQHDPGVLALLEQVDAHQRDHAALPSQRQVPERTQALPVPPSVAPSPAVPPSLAVPLTGPLSLTQPQWSALKENSDITSMAARVAYLQSLIQADIKLTALKDLQGRIWQEGYERGELISPLFDDVASCLNAWHQQGSVLAVYSSGSVAAQQLLYQYSNFGDLRPLFSHWFDTHLGPKQQPSSYLSICEAMAAVPGRVLFISDSPGELQAARIAGLCTIASDRPGNPARPDPATPLIQSFSQLTILD